MPLPQSHTHLVEEYFYLVHLSCFAKRPIIMLVLSSLSLTPLSVLFPAQGTCWNRLSTFPTVCDLTWGKSPSVRTAYHICTAVKVDLEPVVMVYVCESVCGCLLYVCICVCLWKRGGGLGWPGRGVGWNRGIFLARRTSLWRFPPFIYSQINFKHTNEQHSGHQKYPARKQIILWSTSNSKRNPSCAYQICKPKKPLLVDVALTATTSYLTTLFVRS